MKWVSFDRKKRKLDTSLLVLGTGGGDVMALDVSVSQLKWKISDCHPRKFRGIGFPEIVMKGVPDTCGIFVVSKGRVKTELTRFFTSTSKFGNGSCTCNHIKLIFMMS
ncbi:hypothetical protein RND81_11G095800 [Saponaria officinalis]|uniref:Uncharacterized protein n=1 Tax=Saponaria officinalis TaxID=3572 RepID=A0AAW1HKB6_SAPOF